MPLQECGLNLNRGLKELQPHGTLDFPCAGYSSHHQMRPEDVIPWHWHEEIEIVHVEQGHMDLRSSSASFRAGAGDVVIFNSNVLHYGSAAPEGTIHSLVFSPSLIAGNDDSVFSVRYMQPLVSCAAFSGFIAGPEERQTVEEWFSAAFEAIEKGYDGFEFIVRENLSRICLFLFRKFEPQMERKTRNLDQDGIRIKKMLDYIHGNYADSISLGDISRIADISERECLRCFRKVLQSSPIQYLMKYRMMRGAEMLLSDPLASVSEIASGCGFDSPSNFAKQFGRFYGCSPREYRRTRRDDSCS